MIGTISNDYRRGVRARCAAATSQGWNVSPSARERAEESADYLRGFRCAAMLSDRALERELTGDDER